MTALSLPLAFIEGEDGDDCLPSSVFSLGFGTFAPFTNPLKNANLPSSKCSVSRLFASFSRSISNLIISTSCDALDEGEAQRRVPLSLLYAGAANRCGGGGRGGRRQRSGRGLREMGIARCFVHSVNAFWIPHSPVRHPISTGGDLPCSRCQSSRRT